KGNVVHGEADGFFVTAGDLSGYGKPGSSASLARPRAAYEKIASDLAFDLGLPVPPCLLWERPGAGVGQEKHCCVSLVPFQQAWQWRQVRHLPPENLERILLEVKEPMSAMVPFDTWVGNGDRV